MERLSGVDRVRSPAWKWQVCGILLLATMLNYMDRQTLSMTITEISRELHLNNEQYGNLEFGFGVAFAVGGLVTGLLADFVSIRWLYPLVLAGWSISGFAAAYAESIGEVLTPPALRETLSPGYAGLLACRIALGFFEAGQWPCALVTSQRLLSPQDRPLGNSLLQSGAAIGAILTPLVVQMLVTDAPGSWRTPFQLIGVFGLAWIVPWLLTVRAGDLRRRDSNGASPRNIDGGIQVENKPPALGDSATGPRVGGLLVFCRRFAALLLTVILINLCFHFFRAWLPKFLREFHGYNRESVNYFTAAYYVATDAGCLSVGLAVKRLTLAGWPLHRARMTTFAACGCLTGLSALAAHLPAGPLLLALLLLIGFGALGLFPNYYSLTQELSTRHQGIVTGVLGCATWTCIAAMQHFVGQRVDQTGSYADGIFMVGLLPLVACAVLLALWGPAQGPACPDVKRL
ncbi:MAG TPA: MFS transporter [Pirellulales bacterium]|jgi:ACS family hexuronate transporter-like MFS transporter|nr:MFS transporter [Pirellulales bacterium]